MYIYIRDCFKNLRSQTMVDFSTKKYVTLEMAVEVLYRASSLIFPFDTFKDNGAFCLCASSSLWGQGEGLVN